jgi:uncharacterized protein YciI
MPSAAAQQQMRSMLNKCLYVVLRATRDARRLEELLEAHLQWAILAERRGVLFASGPFVAHGVPPGALGGMSIVRASSEAEARNILAEDPFVAQGAVEIDVRRWLLMEGGVTVTVRFSAQTGRIT